MENILAAIAARPDCDNADHLAALVAALRPRRAVDIAAASNNLRALLLLLRTRPEFAEGLREHLLHLLAAKKHVHLYTDTGILSNEGYFTALWKRLSHTLLPEAVNPDYLRDLFGQVFNRRSDHLWVEGVADDLWVDLFEAIDLSKAPDREGRVKAYTEVLEALQILSYRVTAIGLEPELVRNYPAIEEFGSPFLAQNEEIRAFCKSRLDALADSGAAALDDKHIEVLLDQCMVIIGKIRRQASQGGASISLTYLLERLTGMIARMRTIIAMIDLDREDVSRMRNARLSMFRELVREENQKNSILSLTSRVTDLIALRVTENASHTGEHYISTTRDGYFEMMRSALGAGFIVGFMALIKIVLSKMKHSPFSEAFGYSMNYSLGFMFVHVCHFTIATKQPAMTASTLAATVEEVGGGRAREADLDNLADLVVATFRTQLVAIFGNVAAALPISFVIAFTLNAWQGQQLITPEKAQHLLHDIDPFHSLALFHAAIAGVCLFLAGLISGYYDNKALYNRFPQRIQQLGWLNTLLGHARVARFAGYMSHNTGALAGNFFFGIMLGCMGTLGFIFGLPIDIRHVTFSSANFSYALVALDYQVGWQTWLISFAGIGLVGMTNLLVSFSLALYVAMKARQVRFNQSGRLIGKLFLRFRHRPREFFLPPPAEKVVTPNA